MATVGEADTIVIGGGAVGLACALALLGRGAAVTVVDAGEIGRGASFGNAGLVVPSHVIPLAAPGMVALGLRSLADPQGPFALKPRLDPAFAGWLWRFSRAATTRRMRQGAPVLGHLLVRSRALFAGWQRDLPGGVGLVERGLLMLHRTARGRDELLLESSEAATLGQVVREVDAGAVAALAPGLELADGVGGLHFGLDAHLDPAVLVGRLATAVRAAGGVILERTPVDAIDAPAAGAGGRTTVRSGARSLSAETVVVCTGAWSRRLVGPLGVRLPLEAGKGYSLTYADTAGPIVLPLVLHEARVAVTPLGGGTLRLAGTMELRGLDSRLDAAASARRLTPIARALPDYVRGVVPGDPSTATRWAGLRPCSPDGLPYIGRLRRTPSVVVATGHAMLGISLAPVTGELVASLLAGERPTPDLDLRPLSPERYG